MKTIQSFGGPILGVDHDLFNLWDGIAGKRFIGEQSSFMNDYDAICNVTNSIGKLTGACGEGLVIAMPFETAVIETDRNSTYIAQVECAEPSWSFSHINMIDFDKAYFNPVNDVHFSTKTSRYVFFDSSCPSHSVGEECIKIDLSQGKYLFSFALYDPNPYTNLLLYRIARL